MWQVRPRKFRELGWGIQGPRGAGKDAFGAYLACTYMLGGIPCYSNTEIDALWQEGHVHTENLFTSQLLSLGQAYVNAEGQTVEGFQKDCLIYMSEMDKLAHKFRRMTNMNMVLRILATQLRKDGISFIGTAQDWFWVDPDWIFQTDVLARCDDLAFTEYGIEEHMPEGYETYVRLFDLSGMMTGHPYKETGKPYYDFYFQTRMMWDPEVNGGQGPLYNSYKLYGLEDMLTKIVLDKKERHISSPDAVPQGRLSDFLPESPAFDMIKAGIDNFRNEGRGEITNSEFITMLQSAGFKGNPQQANKQAEKLGLKRIKNKAGDIFSLEGVNL